jgi:hypothetical protein
MPCMAVWAPPSAGWHKPENAAALGAYSAAVAFESVCAVGRVQPVAWPGGESSRNSGQFAAFTSYLGALGSPPAAVLQPLVGEPIRALRADGQPKDGESSAHLAVAPPTPWQPASPPATRTSRRPVTTRRPSATACTNHEASEANPTETGRRRTRQQEPAF